MSGSAGGALKAGDLDCIVSALFSKPISPGLKYRDLSSLDA